jgi:WD40 repeat protein
MPAWPFVLVSVLAVLVAGGVLAWGSGARQARRQVDATLEAAAEVREDPTRAAVLLRMAGQARDRATWTNLANASLQETLSQGVLRGLDGPVDALAFSPDGDRVLTLSGGVPAIWSVARDTAPLARAAGVAGSGIVDAAFRPDGGAVLLVTRTGAVMEWDPAQSAPRRLWSPETTSTTAAAVAISGTGSHVLVATEAGWTIVDHAGATIARGRLPEEDGVAPGAPTAAAIDEDGTRWAIAGRDGRIHLWNSELPDPARIRHPGVTKIEINAEGSHLLSLGDGRLRLTDLTHMRGVTRTPTPVQVHAATFSPIGRHILVDYTHRDTGAHHARTLSVDLRTEQFETEPLRVPATALLVDETRDRLLRGREDGRVEELDRRDGRVLRVLRGHRGRVTALRTSPDGRWLASASADQTVRVWSNRDPDPPRVLPLPAALLGADQVTLSDDGGARLAHLEPRGWVRLPLERADLPPEPSEPPDTGAPDGGSRGTRDGRIVAADGQEVSAFHLATTATCASPDGRWIGAVSQVGEVVRWDRETGDVAALGSVEPAPRRCHISHDGGTLMTRGRVEVQVWRAGEPGAPVLKARAAPEQDGPTARLSAGGDTLTTLDESGSVRRWTLDPAALSAQLWARSPTCGGTPEQTDLERFCACEACFGRHPEVCDSVGGGPLDALSALTDPGVCPGS